MPLERILPFLAEIGIPVRERPLTEPTFLPGIMVEDGGLVLDRSQAYAGDLLHEAGHLAVLPPSKRSGASGDLKSDPGEEMAAIAWSYAACRHLALPTSVLFHPDGYKGGSQSLAENFDTGRYFGVPLLAWFGLTLERSDEPGAVIYPRMSRWLRSEPAG